MKFRIGAVMLLLVLFSPSRLRVDNSASASQWVIWNVGQGQWVTHVSAHECWHFDTGGEHFPAHKIKQLCGAKKNRVYLSHWDLDHVSFAGKLRKIARDSCLASPPLGRASTRKRNLLKDYLPCQENVAGVEKLYTAASEKSSNGRSQVFGVFQDVLIPGDSSSAQEKIWASSGGLQKIKILILGHHGSRTSTSEFLLNALPALKVAIASARFRRYGHPHAETLARLKRHSVPVLRTEDWGHLHLAMPAD